MSLIRPMPRHADDVSDAFERLYSASPMSKLLSVESGCNANNSSLNMLIPSSFKFPAMSTPVAKIFLQLKKSEGNASINSDGHSRHGSSQLGISNTDSDSSRLSLERQQWRADEAQCNEPSYSTRNSFIGRNISEAVGQSGHINSEGRPSMETQKDYMVHMSPRVCLHKLDEAVHENYQYVTGGQESLHDGEEESVGEDVQSNDEQTGLDLEGNGDSQVEIVAFGHEDKMMSRYDLKEREEAVDEVEMTEDMHSEQMRKKHVHTSVRKRRKKARVRNRSFVPVESESSETEIEMRIPKTCRWRHHLEKNGDREYDAGTRDLERRGKHGSEVTIKSEKIKRMLSEEDEQSESCEVNGWTSEAPVNRSQHLANEKHDKIDTEPRDMCDSESEEEEARKQPLEDDWECDGDKIVRRMSRQEQAATDNKHPHSEIHNENKCSQELIPNGTKQITSRLSKTNNRHIRSRSNHHRSNERADDEEDARRKTRSFSQEKNSMQKPLVWSPSSSDEKPKRPNRAKTRENIEVVSCETPPFRRVTRIMSEKRRAGVSDRSGEAEDRIHRKKAAVDDVRAADKREANRRQANKKTAGLCETPIVSRKMPAVKQHTLENWTIIQLGRNIGVDGHRPGDPANQYWHSNAIVKRISSRAVCTISGTVYTLRGKLAEEETLAGGFSKKVVTAFRRGFPETWKEVIHENLEKKSSKRFCKSQADELKTPKMKSTRKSNNVKDHWSTASTDTSVTVSTLPTTRSGRHVIPQLAWWTGQRIMVDPHCQTVAIAAGTPDTQCSSVSLDRVKKRNKETTSASDGGKSHRTQVIEKSVGKLDGPKRKLAHQRKDGRTNMPVQCLFNEKTADVNRGNVANGDDSNDQQNSLAVERDDRQQCTETIGTDDCVKTLLFLERHERNGVNAVMPIHPRESLAGETDSYVSDSTNNSLGHEDANPVCKLDYLNGIRTASVTSRTKVGTGPRLSKNQQTKPGCVANLKRDIHRILHENKRTNATHREKTTPCYSLRSDVTEENYKSDDDTTHIRDFNADDVRHNTISSNIGKCTTALVDTPHQLGDIGSPRRRRNNYGNRHAFDMMPLDILQSQERVTRGSVMSSTHKKTPLSHYNKTMADDILCRSVEHKQLFSSEGVEGRRHNDKHPQRNSKSDKAGRSGKGCAKERNTIGPEDRLKQDNSRIQPRNYKGRFYSPEKKDAPLSKSKEHVSSTQQESSDDNEDEQVTIRREMLSWQKASKAPQKSKRKTAALSADKQGKLSGMFEGGVGTLKRKRQLREFVEQHECGYENDLFDSTPFQKRKIRKVAPLLGNNAVGDFFSATAGQLSFATPHTTPSTSLRSAWLPTSDKKTPASSMAVSPLLPESINRNAVDRYVNRVKRMSKRRRMTRMAGTMATTRSVVSGIQKPTGATLAAVSSSVFQMANHLGSVDSSNADDYYFSDGSDGI